VAVADRVKVAEADRVKVAEADADFVKLAGRAVVAKGSLVEVD